MSTRRTVSVFLSLGLCALLAGVAPSTAFAPPAPSPVRHVSKVLPTATGDNFGFCVAIDGDYAVVGVPYTPDDAVMTGAAYVYHRTAAGWEFDQALTHDSEPGDRFGHSVDIEGDRIIVGAPSADTLAADNAGAAIVYRLTPSGWVFDQWLEADATTVGDTFGKSVAISGSVRVVGCPGDDQLAGDAGAIYIYRQGVPGYTKYMSSASEAGADYGWSVDASGDYIISGAPWDDTATGTNAGSASTYHWNGAIWQFQDILFGSDAGASDLFGYSVSLSGDRALVGAMGYDDGAVTDAGAAYAFTRSGIDWPETQLLTLPEPDVGASFGKAVSVDGSFALVGAHFDDAYAGSAHVYAQQAGMWALLGKTSPDGSDSGYGYSVAADSEGHGISGCIMSGSGAGNAYFLSRLEPVYRFYNGRSQTHFYTPDAGERDHIIATWPTIFSYEGPAYDTNPHNNTQPLFRFYNVRNGSHFYTADPTEAADVMARLGHTYSYDGPTYSVLRADEPAAVPVFRFYNVRNGSHFFTASATERDDVVANLGYLYRYEGPAFYLGQ